MRPKLLSAAVVLVFTSCSGAVPCDALGLAPSTQVDGGQVLVTDLTRCQALILGGDQASGGVSLRRCPLGGGDCTSTMLAPGSTGASRLLVDAPRSRLVGVVAGAPVKLFACQLDGTGCQFTPLESAGVLPAASLRIAADGTIVYLAGVKDHIARCPAPPGACSSVELTGLPRRVEYPDFALDAEGNGLIVFENKEDNSRLWYGRCDAVGSCTAGALSATTTGFSSLPVVMIDGDGSVVIASVNLGSPGRIIVHRCGPLLDGTNCTHVDVLPGQVPSPGLQAAVDPKGGLRLASVDTQGQPFVTRCTMSGTECSTKAFPEAPKVTVGFRVFASWTAVPSPVGDAQLALIQTADQGTQLVRLDL
jgi:hypothetical protein